MNTNEIEKVAEKVGEAFNVLKPVAEELVRQVQMWGLFRACISIIGITISFYLIRFVFIRSFKKIQLEENEETNIAVCIISAVLSFAFGLTGMINLFEGAYSYFAPLARILKM